VEREEPLVRVAADYTEEHRRGSLSAAAVGTNWLESAA